MDGSVGTNWIPTDFTGGVDMGDAPVITGTGHYVPDQVVTNAGLEERWGKPDGWIISRTGVEERRKAGKNETTGSMAVSAGRRALENADLAPDRVSLTLLATSTPDKPLPPTAPSIQDALDTQGGAFDLAGSCVGFLDALSAGSQYIRSGTHDHVLIVASNHLTYRVNWSDPETASLFGDGAGAVVLSGETSINGSRPSRLGLERITLGSDGSVDSLDVPAGGSLEPFSPEAWENDRHLMRMKEGRGVFRMAVEKQVNVARTLLARAALKTADIDWFIPHQANKKIMSTIAKKLGLQDELLSNITRYGNTSAASIPIMLDEARQSGMFESGDQLLLTAFGCGIRFGGGLLSCE